MKKFFKQVASKMSLVLLCVSYTPEVVAGDDFIGKIRPNFWKAVIKLRSEVTGTGFLVSRPASRDGQTNNLAYLITCKHVLGDWNLANGDISTFYTNLDVHFYTKDLTPIRFKMLDDAGNLKRQVLLHPNPKVDVAAIALLNEFKLEADYNALALDTSLFLSFTNQNFVGLGDLVFALGYPLGITSSRNNYPLPKGGHVSSLPHEEFRVELPVNNRSNQVVQAVIEGKIYVVDGQIVPGNSGGPVVIPAESRAQTGIKGGNTVFYTYETDNRIVGIVSMLMTGTGLSVVYSSDYILDLIDSHQSRISGMVGNVISFKSR